MTNKHRNAVLNLFFFFSHNTCGMKPLTMKDTLYYSKVTVKTSTL